MSKSVVFYQAHEDGAGCSEPKPYELTALLDSLEGLHYPIDEAIADIQAVVPDAWVTDCGDYIRVQMGEELQFGGRRTRQFSYCAIKYMEVPEHTAEAIVKEAAEQTAAATGLSFARFAALFHRPKSS
jgi:hypothetical protein